MTHLAFKAAAKNWPWYTSSVGCAISYAGHYSTGSTRRKMSSYGIGAIFTVSLPT
ncbi:MAG: hypothetical protein ACRYFX_11950 [Janthinobacterium lividum]